VRVARRCVRRGGASDAEARVARRRVWRGGTWGEKVGVTRRFEVGVEVRVARRSV
jgi:hypothetical protein